MMEFAGLATVAMARNSSSWEINLSPGKEFGLEQKLDCFRWGVQGQPRTATLIMIGLDSIRKFGFGISDFVWQWALIHGGQHKIRNPKSQIRNILTPLFVPHAQSVQTVSHVQ